MACDLATTQEAACASGIGKLDNQIPLLQVIAQSMLTQLGGEATLESIQELACESGVGKESSPIVLLQLTAQSLCAQIT